MDAGVVAFRLCDRGFACESCPFDACMRGVPIDAAAHHLDAAWAFPSDRLYSPRHLWAQVISEGRIRAGLDACAARILTPVHRIEGWRPDCALVRGEPFCRLAVEDGEVPIGAPVAGRLTRRNEALDAAPLLALREPYGAGWLAEFALADPGELDPLFTAREAKEAAEADARHFRRQVLFHLLANESGDPPHIDGHFLDAMVRLVGVDPLVALARQVVH